MKQCVFIEDMVKVKLSQSLPYTYIGVVEV